MRRERQNAFSSIRLQRQKQNKSDLQNHELEEALDFTWVSLHFHFSGPISTQSLVELGIQGPWPSPGFSVEHHAINLTTPKKWNQVELDDDRASDAVYQKRGSVMTLHKNRYEKAPANLMHEATITSWGTNLIPCFSSQNLTAELSLRQKQMHTMSAGFLTVLLPGESVF